MTRNERRDMRRRLGLCLHCQKPTVRGYKKCQRHLDENRVIQQRGRDNQAKTRGWALKRVPA